MLYLVATPIGNYDEITLKALEVMKRADVILCESTKETSKLLKHHQITGKKYHVLDEHSKFEDLEFCLELCRTQTVALVSDCGTPGFCDPGADLVRLCRNNEIEIRNCLGASSLMGLISLSGVKIKEFLFKGFLSQETDERHREWLRLKNEMAQSHRPVVVMDTPYRLQKTLTEIELLLKDHEVILALNLGTDEEVVMQGKMTQIKNNHFPKKAEFVLLVLPLNG